MHADAYDAVLPDGPRLSPAETTFRWLAQPFALLDACAEELGDRFRLDFVRFGTHVVVSHPDDVRTVFSGDPAVLHAGRGNALLEPILGRHSLLLIDDAAHAAMRAHLLPAFRAEQVASYVPLILAASRTHTSTWREGDVVSVYRTALAISREVILRAILGLEPHEVDPLARLVEQLMALIGTNAPFDDDPRLAARLTVARSALVEALQRVVEDRRRSGRPGDDLLSLLIGTRGPAGRALADDEIHDQLLTMVLAGHETTASAITWAVLAVLGDDRVLERLTAELDGADAAAPDAGLTGLSYLQAVCLETLRLFPVIPVVSRELMQPFQLGDQWLPAGVFVTPCAYLTQRRADVFPEPAAFRPERFLDRRYPPHVFFPFGGGARRCLGTSAALLEMQMVLGTLLRAFQFQPIDTRPVRPIRRAVTIIPSGGLRMRVAPRHAAGAMAAAPPS